MHSQPYVIQVEHVQGVTCLADRSSQTVYIVLFIGPLILYIGLICIACTIAHTHIS